MAKGVYDKIDGVYKRLLNNLKQNKYNKTNVVVLYAYNGTGKTRLSKNFEEVMGDKILCYNAFFEDYFYWDNDNINFKIDKTSWVFELIRDQGLNSKIIDNFKEFMDITIEPDIDIVTGIITFKMLGNTEKIKISRGEENIFRWSVFYTIVEEAIALLDENQEDRSTDIFDNKKYIIIDDPVSSMDDNRIITIALKVTKLIVDSKDKFNFLITTHHPLFFSVLFHKNKANWNKSNFILSKTESKLKLIKQTNESPFAYHHTVIEEIQDAIKKNTLKKYHFNLFRTLLEKTANFLGQSEWKMCLNGINNSEDFFKLIDHYSHDKISELEYNNLMDSQIEIFKTVFTSFLSKYSFKERN